MRWQKVPLKRYSKHGSYSTFVGTALDRNCFSIFLNQCRPPNMYVLCRRLIQVNDKRMRILNFSTFDAISWWNSNVISFNAPSGISSFDVVAWRRRKPILRYKLYAQCDDSTSTLPIKCEFLVIKALAVLTATPHVITEPRLLATRM